MGYCWVSKTYKEEIHIGNPHRTRVTARGIMRAKQAAVVRSSIGSGTDSGGTPCEGLELRLSWRFSGLPWFSRRHGPDGSPTGAAMGDAARTKKYMLLLKRFHIVGCGGPFPKCDLGVGRCLPSDRPR